MTALLKLGGCQLEPRWGRSVPGFSCFGRCCAHFLHRGVIYIIYIYNGFYDIYIYTPHGISYPEFRFPNSSEILVSCSCARSRSCALELFQPFWKDACLNKETHSLYVLGNWMDYSLQPCILMCSEGFWYQIAC